MNKARKKIIILKSQLAQQVENDIANYKRAIIREIDYRWRTLKNKSEMPDIKQLQEEVLKRLRIPPDIQKAIASELEETQKQIAQVWNDYFTKAINSKEIIQPAPGDYEKMLASYKVDFPALTDTLRDTVKREFIQSIKSDYSFEQLRSNLRKNGLGDFQATTEANTAIAQFDNAYHVENALQAGVEEFLWDGPPPMENSHSLCIENTGKTFTLTQLSSMYNGTDLPVETALGGYNCRHYLTAVIVKENDK